MTRTRVPYALLRQQRFAFDPLYRVLVAMRGEELSETQVSEIVGVTNRTVSRWKVQGLLFHSADRAAVAAGLHPSLIWPDWWDVPWADVNIERSVTSDVIFC